MSGVTDNEKKLAVAIIGYIRAKIDAKQISADQAESLEVAIQCLETGFAVAEADYAFQPSRPILHMFENAEGLAKTAAAPPPRAAVSDADKAAAEALKNAGNDLVKAAQYDAAVQKYTEALALDNNAVFLCNRAAAYQKMDQHDLAIQDCRAAIALQPNYAKAYARMGTAMSAQNRHADSVNAFRTALEIEPNNDVYKNNLDVAQQKANTAPAQQAQAGAQAANPFAAMFGGAGGAGGLGGLGGPGGPDLSSLLNNPAMVQMATQVMSDPNMQNMMGNLMSGMMQQPGGEQGMGGLLQAGQALAQQMQQANPDLVNQLRQQTNQGANPDGSRRDQNDGDQNPDNADKQ